MVKQWKKSLEQGDILSDETPFDGSNIDKPLSSAGDGLDNQSLTVEYQSVNSNTITVNGEGLIRDIYPTADIETTIDLSIDGNSLITSMNIGGTIGYNHIPFVYFSSSFNLTADGEVNVSYGLV